MSKNTTCTCATYFPIIINQGIIDHFIQQLVEQMNLILWLFLQAYY